MNLTSAQAARLGCVREQGGAQPRGKVRKKRRPTPVNDLSTTTEYSPHGMSMSIWFPIRAESEMNNREHWAARNRRKKTQQAIVMSKRRGFVDVLTLVPAPYRITLTRVGPRLMDSDNNAASLKHVQDQVARELGIDDGDRTKAEWKHDQLKQPFYAVRVHIEQVL